MTFTETRGTREAFAKDPAVVRFQNTYFLYYSCYISEEGREKLGIGISRSDDLENWEFVSFFPLTQECEKNGVGAPAAYVEGEELHLFYQTYGNGKNDAICHAVSDNGVDFVKDDTNPVFHPSDDWCCGRAIDADVVAFSGKLFLYFATRDHQMRIQKIGCAYAPLKGDYSRKSWRQAKKGAVLFPELSWERDCVEAPATFERKEKLYMFYGGAYNCEPQQIGVAVSENGVDFEKLFSEPILKNGKKGEWNESESGHPYVFFDDDGRKYLFFQGSPDHGESWYISKKEIVFFAR